MTMAATGRRGLDTTLNQRQVINGAAADVGAGDIMVFNEARLASTPTVDTNKVGRDTSGKVVTIRPVTSELRYGKFCVATGPIVAGQEGPAVVTGDDVMITIVFTGNESAGAPVIATNNLHTGRVEPAAITGEKVIATLNEPWTGGAGTGTVSCSLRGDVGWAYMPAS